MIGQSPRPDGTARVRWYGWRRIARRLEEGPRHLWYVPDSTPPRRRFQITSITRPAAGKLRRYRGRAGTGRILGPRTGTHSRRTRSPAEHAPAARGKVGGAVDGGHGGTGRRNELEAFLVSTAEQPATASPVLMTVDAGRRTAVFGTRSTSRVAPLYHEPWVVWAWTQRTLCPAITPSDTYDDLYSLDSGSDKNEKKYEQRILQNLTVSNNLHIITTIIACKLKQILLILGNIYKVLRNIFFVVCRYA